MLFTSDNWAPVHPAIWSRLTRINAGSAPAYGRDQETLALEAMLASLFGRPVALAHVATGSAANALALACLTPPWGAVLAHESAHIVVDECGAPEFFTHGAKLIPIAGEAGKLQPDAVAAALDFFTPRVPHHVVPSVLSLTQATEYGTLYTPAEIRTLSDLAHARGLKVHMDGARLANACAALSVDLAAMTFDAGVDALSFGGTKNGALAAELVVFADPAYKDELGYRQKRAGQVFSKGRFLAAQWLALLEDDLWLVLARAANAAAARLAHGLSGIAGVSLPIPVGINEVFVDMPHTLAAALRAAGAQFYDWVQPQDAYDGRLRRFVTHFATDTADIDAFIATARRLA